MKIKALFSAIALIALTVSCSNNDDPTPTPIPEGGAFKGVIFATGITNPEGNNGSIYLQALSDFVPGSYDNKNTLPTGFGATPIALPNGNIYSFPDYMGNSKAEIARYNLSNDGKWIKKGALPIPAGANACNVVELNHEKAYVSLQGLGLVRVFNPTTMTKIKDIDLNSLQQKDAKVSPAAMIIRDGKLYVGLNQMNAQWMPTQNSIELAMIDVQTDELKKHIVNKTHGLSFATRPIDPNSIFMDENKDIYINCMGAFGFIPDFPGGIVRIKNGSDEIDPDYVIRLNQTEVKGLSTKYAEFIASMYYAGNGKLYIYGNSYGLDAQGMARPYLSLTHFPGVIDLKEKTITKIANMEISNPQGIAIAKYKNLIVFGSANKKATGFYTYNPENKEVKGPVINVQGNPGFFYSYAK